MDVNGEDLLIVGFILLFGILIGSLITIASIEFDAEDGVIERFGHRFVRVDAEPEEAWCEEWVCEESDMPFCYYRGTSGSIEITTGTNERGECDDDFIKVSQCVSRSRVWRRC